MTPVKNAGSSMWMAGGGLHGGRLSEGRRERLVEQQGELIRAIV